MKRIKKTVGQARAEEPLDRAFRLHCLVLELTGEKPRSVENVRKTVGRKSPYQR